MALKKGKQNSSNSEEPGYTGFKFMYKRKDSGEELEIQWPPLDILKKRSKIFKKIHRKNRLLKILIWILLACFIGYGYSSFLKGVLQ
ncbi:MAG: hypothetical protein HN366_29180 [Deltaproteobacteria bacterium]|jgi:hypothetical protein|nr:hypothetical protein [Deltaproteobacteria bacterium]